MVDYSTLLISGTNILLVIALFYFGYMMLKKMFKKMISEAMNEAIVKLDEKVKIINSLRNLK